MEDFGIKRRTVKEARSFRFEDRKYRNRSWLFRKYWLQNYGINSLSNLCNVSESTIRYWLRKNKIRIRNPVEGYRLQWGTPDKSHGSLLNKILLVAEEIIRRLRIFLYG